MMIAGPRQFIIEFLQACDWEMVEIGCYFPPTTATNDGVFRAESAAVGRKK